jgi:hypothetical protein
VTDITVIAWLALDGCVTVTVAPAETATVRSDEHTTVRTPFVVPTLLITSASTVQTLAFAGLSAQLTVPAFGSSAIVTIRVEPDGTAFSSATLLLVAAVRDPKVPCETGVPIAAAARSGPAIDAPRATSASLATIPTVRIPPPPISNPSAVQCRRFREAPSAWAMMHELRALFQPLLALACERPKEMFSSWTRWHPLR